MGAIFNESAVEVSITVVVLYESLSDIAILKMIAI
jgi:hypothetical protein